MIAGRSTSFSIVLFLTWTTLFSLSPSLLSSSDDELSGNWHFGSWWSRVMISCTHRSSITLSVQEFFTQYVQLISSTFTGLLLLQIPLRLKNDPFYSRNTSLIVRPDPNSATNAASDFKSTLRKNRRTFSWDNWCMISCTVFLETPGTTRRVWEHFNKLLRAAASSSCRFKIRRGIGFVHARKSW